MDLSKLRPSERVIVASATVLLLASFLPWFTADYGPFGELSWSGWQVELFVGRLPVILGIVMAGHVLISRFSPGLALPAWPWPAVHRGAGIAAAALVLLKLVLGHRDGTSLVDVPVDRSIGLYLATLAALGLAAGGVLYERERR